MLEDLTLDPRKDQVPAYYPKWLADQELTGREALQQLGDLAAVSAHWLRADVAES